MISGQCTAVVNAAAHVLALAACSGRNETESTGHVNADACVARCSATFLASDTTKGTAASSMAFDVLWPGIHLALWTLINK
eukprot:m.278245 g.278245  ORF g.278245 m.278245 type:complete len:81 (+) comp119629_c0_seq1:91-333(+)